MILLWLLRLLLLSWLGLKIIVLFSLYTSIDESLVYHNNHFKLLMISEIVSILLIAGQIIWIRHILIIGSVLILFEFMMTIKYNMTDTINLFLQASVIILSRFLKNNRGDDVDY